jgi:hypothetical protein
MRTTNKRRPLLEIPKDEIDALPPELHSVFTTLNERLKTLSELHESTAGLRGPVGIARQSKKDPRGVVMPGLLLEGNRAGDAADPIDDQDLVTLGYLKRQLKCDKLTAILEDCEDTDNVIDEDAAPSACAVLELSNKKSVSTGMATVYCCLVLDPFVYVAGI